MKNHKLINDLVSIISTLKPNEIRVLKNKLTISFHKEETSICYQLIDCALNRKTLSAIRYIHDLNLNRKFLIKFYLSIENLFVTDKLFGREAGNELRNIRLAEVKKKLILCSVFQNRGLFELYYETLNSICSISKKFEFFKELTEALESKRSLLIGQNKIKEANEVELEFLFYKKLRNASEEVRLIADRTELMAKENLSTERLICFLEESIIKIKTLLITYPSSNNLAYLQLIQLEYYERSLNFKSCLNEGLKLENYIVSNISIYSKNRLIYIRSKISKYYQFDLRFIESKQTANNALKLLGKSRNSLYVKVLKVLVVSKFYLKEYSENEKLISNLLKTNIAKAYPNRLAISYYYLAVNRFMLSEYRKARIALNKTEEYFKDKYEWNAWVRLLRILITIELKKFELVEYQIQANRKYLSAHKSQIRPRLHCINKLLLGLIRNDFDFNYASKKKSALLESLENDPSLAWNINSPELIQFHNWYKSKSEGTEYKAVFTRSN